MMFNPDFKFLFHIERRWLYLMHRHSKSAASTGGGVPSAVPGDGPIEISIRAALTEIDKANIFLLERPGCIQGM